MRVAVVEDSALLREGLVRLLEAEQHDVTVATADALTLLKALQEQVDAGSPPDVVVLDVRLPPTFVDEGIVAALQIRRRWPAVGVLVLSQYVERQHAADLLTEGAEGVGYLLKDRVVHVSDFLDALERVCRGGTALDPEVVRRLLARPARDRVLDRLTPREHDVLALLAQGLTNAAIGERLHLSQSAVEKHASVIFDKLELTAGGGYNLRTLAVIRYLQWTAEAAGEPGQG